MTWTWNFNIELSQEGTNFTLERFHNAHIQAAVHPDTQAEQINHRGGAVTPLYHIEAFSRVSVQGIPKVAVTPLSSDSVTQKRLRSSLSRSYGGKTNSGTLTRRASPSPGTRLYALLPIAIKDISGLLYFPETCRTVSASVRATCETQPTDMATVLCNQVPEITIFHCQRSVDERGARRGGEEFPLGPDLAATRGVGDALERVAMGDGRKP